MPLTNEERTTLGTDAKKALDKAKTKDELSVAWKEHYLKIGHKALGRLLLGQTVENAMKVKGGGAA